MWDPYAEFQTATLPNGLTVYASQWVGRPWEAVGFVVHTGAKHDPVGLEGLAHFVEHLVSQNTSTSSIDMKRFFEDFGGTANFGGTSYDSTSYSFFVPTNEELVQKALSMFGQMLLSAKLEQKIEKERQVVLAEFNQYYPTKLKLDLCTKERQVLYPGHWLERFVRPLGLPESIKRITQEDIQLHYDANYTPANISIVCVGGMSMAEVVRALSLSPFAITKKGIRIPVSTPMVDFPPLKENRYAFSVSEFMQTEVPVRAGSYTSTLRIPGDVNIRLIMVLKEMLNYILDEEVRQKRSWTYSIGSHYYNHGDLYEYEIVCGSLEIGAIDKIERVVEDCIATVGESEELFEQTKKSIIARSLMIDCSAGNICQSVMDCVSQHHRIVAIDEYTRNTLPLTLSDVRDLLRRFQSVHRYTVISRP